MNFNLRISLLCFLFVSILLPENSAAIDALGNNKENFTDQTGKRQGYWRITGALSIEEGYKKSSIVEEGEYIDNKRHGLWRKYYPTGSIRSEITYELNKPNGYYAIFHDNGKLEETGTWKGNKNVGEFKRYYENGKTAQEFNFTRTGKRNGIQRYFYENGNIQMSVEIEDGVAHGMMKTYYRDGSEKSVKRITNGITEEGSIKNFEPSTTNTVKTADPKLPKQETTPAEDKPNLTRFNASGFNTLYNRNQQVSQVGKFEEGRLWDGKWYRYDQNGLLRKVEVYKSGRFIGYGIIDDKNN